jgi:tetratricopeptide (TPR) repeat protein
MFLRTPISTAIVVTVVLGVCPFFANGQEPVAAPTQTAAPKPEVVDEFPGTDDFEEASRIRVIDSTRESFSRVIELCKSALEKGLDEFDTMAAKKMLSTTALQRAQMTIEEAAGGRVPNNRMARIANEAMQDLAVAIEADPSLADALMLKARIHIVRQEIGKGQETLEQAQKVLEEAIAAGASDGETKNKLSEVLLMKSVSRQDADERLKDLMKAIEVSPDNERAIQLTVETLVTVGRFDDAEATLRKFMEAAPENEYAVRRLALLMIQNEKLQPAVEFLTKQIETHPDRSVLYSLRSSVYFAMASQDEEIDRLERSMADATKALELDAENLDAVLTRAKAALGLKNLDQAKKDLEVLESARPELPDIVLLRMDIAIQEKRFADAITDMERLVQLNPDNRMLLMQLAAFYQMDDRPKKALRIADRLLKADVTDWQSLRLRGDILLALGRHTDAIADYESAIANIPEDEEDFSGILNNLSWVMSTSPENEVRNGKRALELGLKACELTQYSKPHILSTLAAAYAELLEFEKAIEWSQKAVELGRKEGNEQVEQLEEELKSYRDNKPWREKKEIEDKPNKPAPADSGVDT